MNLSLKMAKLSLVSLLVLPSLAMAACNSNMAASTTLTDNGDGTVSDSKTGLMWKRCTEGFAVSGLSCTSGTLIGTNWSAALKRAADVNAGTAGEKLGHSDWRLPNINELTSIVEYKCSSPAIDSVKFPGLPQVNAGYWSSSPVLQGTSTFADQVWYVELGNGITAPLRKNQGKYIRLVRTE